MHDAMLLALMMADSSDHTTTLHAVAYIVPAICIALFLFFLKETGPQWKATEDGRVRSISRERAEKSADNVITVCALLIPATLAQITWLNEKVGRGIYMLPLVMALLSFFGLLAFTIHLKINFFWRHDADFIVTSKHNARFAYWLTTAMTAIVLGLILLSVPVIELAFGFLHLLKPSDPPPPPPIKVECKCKPPEPPPPPPCKQSPPPHPHHHHRRSFCVCQKK